MTNFLEHFQRKRRLDTIGSDQKVCPNSCSSNGQCQYYGQYDELVSTCLVQDFFCRAQCSCDSGFDGKDCSVTSADVATIQEGKANVCSTLYSTLMMEDITADVVESRSDSVRESVLDPLLISQDGFNNCTTFLLDTIDLDPEIASTVHTKVFSALAAILEGDIYGLLNSTLRSRTLESIRAVALYRETGLETGVEDVPFIDQYGKDYFRVLLQNDHYNEMYSSVTSSPLTALQTEVEPTKISSKSIAISAENAYLPVGLYMIEFSRDFERVDEKIIFASNHHDPLVQTNWSFARVVYDTTRSPSIASDLTTYVTLPNYAPPVYNTSKEQELSGNVYCNYTGYEHYFTIDCGTNGVWEDKLFCNGDRAGWWNYRCNYHVRTPQCELLPTTDAQYASCSVHAYTEPLGDEAFGNITCACNLSSVPINNIIELPVYAYVLDEYTDFWSLFNPESFRPTYYPTSMPTVLFNNSYLQVIEDVNEYDPRFNNMFYCILGIVVIGAGACWNRDDKSKVVKVSIFRFIPRPKVPTLEQLDEDIEAQTVTKNIDESFTVIPEELDDDEKDSVTTTGSELSSRAKSDASDSQSTGTRKVGGIEDMEMYDLYKRPAYRPVEEIGVVPMDSKGNRRDHIRNTHLSMAMRSNLRTFSSAQRVPSTRSETLTSPKTRPIHNDTSTRKSLAGQILWNIQFGDSDVPIMEPSKVTRFIQDGSSDESDSGSCSSSSSSSSAYEGHDKEGADDYNDESSDGEVNTQIKSAIRDTISVPVSQNKYFKYKEEMKQQRQHLHIRKGLLFSPKYKSERETVVESSSSHIECSSTLKRNEHERESIVRFSPDTLGNEYSKIFRDPSDHYPSKEILDAHDSDTDSDVQGTGGGTRGVKKSVEGREMEVEENVDTVDDEMGSDPGELGKMENLFRGSKRPNVSTFDMISPLANVSGHSMSLSKSIIDKAQDASVAASLDDLSFNTSLVDEAAESKLAHKTDSTSEFEPNSSFSLPASRKLIDIGENSIGKLPELPLPLPKRAPPPPPKLKSTSAFKHAMPKVGAKKQLRPVLPLNATNAAIASHNRALESENGGDDSAPVITASNREKLAAQEGKLRRQTIASRSRENTQYTETVINARGQTVKKHAFQHFAKVEKK